MSCAEVRLTEKLLEVYEKHIGSKPPSGVCICVLDDGDVGCIINEEAWSKSNRIERLRMKFYHTPHKVKDVCTGNFIKR